MSHCVKVLYLRGLIANKETRAHACARVRAWNNFTANNNESNFDNGNAARCRPKRKVIAYSILSVARVNLGQIASERQYGNHIWVIKVWKSNEQRLDVSLMRARARTSHWWSILCPNWMTEDGECDDRFGDWDASPGKSPFFLYKIYNSRC